MFLRLLGGAWLARALSFDWPRFLRLLRPPTGQKVDAFFLLAPNEGKLLKQFPVGRAGARPARPPASQMNGG